MRRATPPALLLLLAAACTPPAGEPAATVDVAAGEQAVAAFWAAFSEAEVAENVNVLAGMYMEQAVIDVKGFAPIMGRAALTEIMTQMTQGADISRFEVTPEYTNVVSAHQVHQAGSYVEDVSREGTAATEFGRYAMSLVQEADGQWRIAYLMAFTDSTVTR